MPGLPRQYHEVARMAVQMSGRVKYPIHNFQEAEEALGGEHGSVTFEGKEYQVRQARQLVPPDYFPITSEQDLIAKTHDLLLHAGMKEPDVQWGERRDTPPADAGEPNIPVEQDVPRVAHIVGHQQE